jgi:phosphopantetheine--protein transferase-like protein
MAEAAAALAPDLALTAIETVSARRWIAVDDRPVDLQIVAQRQAEDPASRIAVKVYDAGGAGSEGDDPLIEGIIVLAPHYPPAPDPRVLDAAAAPVQQGPALYGDAMFHGPTFQAVSAITRDGPESMEAVLKVPADACFFASEPTPRFRSDPVLVDAAGQVVGFWATRHLRRGFNVFPYRVETLRFYGPPLPAGADAACRAYVHVDSESRLSSDLDVLRADGSLYLRAEGWQDARVDVPDNLQRMRVRPRTSLLGNQIEIPGEVSGAAVCLLADLPTEALQAFGGICQLMLADLVLSRAERAQWQTLNGNSKRRHEWLLGRAAVKDAVRSLIAGGQPPDVYPADIEVSKDQLGRPVVGRAWGSAPADVPHVSISHSGGIALAAAADCAHWDGVGVDLELLDGRHSDLDSVFTPGECELLDALEPPAREEWCLRLWCAKEAVAKALGTGLAGRPQDLEAVACDEASGHVRISLTARSPSLRHRPGHQPVLARTQRLGDMVIAVALIERTPS